MESVMATSPPRPLDRAVTRVQLDMPTDRVEELDLVKAELGLETRKEFFNNALTLMMWAIREVRKGRVIASVDPVNERFSELRMPVLDTALTSGARRLGAT